MVRRKAKKRMGIHKFIEANWSLFMVGLIGLIFLILFVTKAFAGVETVKDNNDGNLGDILVNTGTKNGQSDVGTWTNPTCIPSLKGDKGDKGDKGATGATGLQGIQGNQGFVGNNGTNGLNGKDGKDGINGKDGKDGINGKDGKDGINGKDGKDGINGKDGNDGEVGPKGDQGDVGLPGVPGEEGAKGDIGDKGEHGIQGMKGLDFDPATLNEQNSKLDNMNSRINKLERTQYVFQGEVRLFDTRKWTGKPFVRYNIQRHKVDTVGFILTYKMGKSYEERQMELLNTRLDRMEKNQPAVIERHYNADGTVKEISIHD
jgi:hypothetical protein